MSEVNPFAPPLNDGARPERVLPAFGMPRFFPVSRTKFTVMCLATFGLYELYWFYQNWKRTKLRTGSQISPGARAFFCLFFTHALLRDVRLAAAEADVEPSFQIQSSAWAFIGLTLLQRLPDPFWLVSLVAFVPLIGVQDTINRIVSRTTPDADMNERFGLGNWIVIVLGFAFVTLGIVGVLLPEEAITP